MVLGTYDRLVELAGWLYIIARSALNRAGRLTIQPAVYNPALTYIYVYIYVGIYSNLIHTLA